MKFKKIQYSLYVICVFKYNTHDMHLEPLLFEVLSYDYTRVSNITRPAGEKVIVALKWSN